MQIHCFPDKLNKYPSWIIYTNRTKQRILSSSSIYHTDLNIFSWGGFFSTDYISTNKRFSASAGIRTDGNNYNQEMKELWKQLSPRFSLSYDLTKQWALSGSAGLYYQLPPYTALDAPPVPRSKAFLCEGSNSGCIDCVKPIISEL